LFPHAASRAQGTDPGNNIGTLIEKNNSGITDTNQFLDNVETATKNMQDSAVQNFGKSSIPSGPASPLGTLGNAADEVFRHLSPPSEIPGIAAKEIQTLKDVDPASKGTHATEMGDLIDKRRCQYNPASCGGAEKKTPGPIELDPSKLDLRNATFMCTPLTTRIEQVRANPKLQFKNECSVGNGIAIGQGQQSVGFIFVTCNGWDSPRITQALSDFPEKTAGPLQRDYQRRTITYLGHPFITPCRPEGGVDIKGGFREIQRFFEPFIK
jgi:hypothetical protein